MGANTTMANQNKMFKAALHMRVKDKDKERHNECALFLSELKERTAKKSKYQLHGWIWWLVQSMQSMLRAQPISWSVVTYNCIREEQQSTEKETRFYHSRYIMRFGLS
jgi:hypothetical protein